MSKIIAGVKWLAAALLMTMTLMMIPRTFREDAGEDENVYVAQNLSGLDESLYVYECTDEEIIGKLKTLSGENDYVKFIYDNLKAYPESFLRAVASNIETAEFVMAYPYEIEKVITGLASVDGLYKKGTMPLFIQWDERWGYYRYGEDVLGISGCGPVCMSMIFVALTGEDKYTPTYMADIAEKYGYYEMNAGTSWSYFDDAARISGVRSRTLALSENLMVQALLDGEYLVLSMGPGIFTSGGHYIVIYGYENGRFLVRDPNSLIRSGETYSYGEIENQIKNIWAFGTYQSGRKD